MRHFLLGSIGLVVAASIISVGAFLGLRSQTVVQVITPAPLAPTSTARASPIALAMPREDPQFAVQVRRQIEEGRATLARTCQSPSRTPVELEMRLIFDGGGKLLSYAVNDPEDPKLLPFAQCVREHRPALRVDGTGTPTTVQFFLAI